MSDADKNKIITGYKAFNTDFRCRNYQYEVGQTFEHEGEIGLCSEGFHFYHKDPCDVFNYGPLIDKNGQLIRFAKVSTDKKDAIIGIDNDRCVTTRITIDEEITLDDLLKKQTESAYRSVNNEDVSGTSISDEKPKLFIATKHDSYLTDAEDDAKIISNKKNTHIALIHNYSTAIVVGGEQYLTSCGFRNKLFATGKHIRLSSSYADTMFYTCGRYSSTASSGGLSQLRIAGDEASTASSGYSPIINIKGEDISVAVSGSMSTLRTKGKNASVSVSGAHARVSATGDNTKQAVSGYDAEVTVIGNNARIAAVGDDSQVTYAGENGVITVLGINAQFKGPKGTLVSAVVYNEEDKPIDIITGCIGENGLKPNTIYTVKSGRFVDFKDQPNKGAEK